MTSQMPTLDFWLGVGMRMKEFGPRVSSESFWFLYFLMSSNDVGFQALEA